jgi:hypothetical protein
MRSSTGNRAAFFLGFYRRFFRLAIQKTFVNETLGKTYLFVGVDQLFVDIGIDAKVLIARAIGKGNF